VSLCQVTKGLEDLVVQPLARLQLQHLNIHTYTLYLIIYTHKYTYMCNMYILIGHHRGGTGEDRADVRCTFTYKSVSIFFDIWPRIECTRTLI
jgi:hypothetical protein